MSVTFDGYIIPGTVGKNNWTYPSGNPAISAWFVVPGYQRSLPGVLYLTERPFSSFTQQELRAILFSGFDGGTLTSYTGYKMAWYQTSTTTYSLYSNVNGSIVSGVGSGGNKGFYFVAVDDDTFIQISSPVIDSQSPNPFNSAIPMFSNQSEMNTWLESDSATIENSDSTTALGTYNGIFSISDGIVRAYKTDDTNLRLLGQLMGLGAFGGNIGNAVIGTKLVMSPGALTVGNDTTIVSKTIGGATYTVSGKPIGKQGQTFDFGTFNFSESFHNFMDYYDTSIKLYLPYCGMQDLDPSVVMGGSIHLYGVIDLISGNILYYLEVNNPDLTTGAQTTTVYTYNGNCSCDIPINSEDYGRKISALASGVWSSAMFGGANIGPLGMVGGAAVGLGASKFITDMATRHITSGSLASNNGFGAVQYPYVIISTPKPLYPANYAHDVGYPCEKNLSLNEVAGYTKIERIHLSIPGAMQSEIDKIEELLKSGVVF